MAISVFDLFRIGIGPSSSHTVGPMRAAGMFVDNLSDKGLLGNLCRIQVELFGSLGATGRGHGTHKALMLGLEGETPEGVDVDAIPARLEQVETSGQLQFAEGSSISFDEKTDLIFHKRKELP